MNARSAISNPLSFYEEAQFQRACAICGKGGSFESHHVVSKQELKKRGLVHILYDPRNALRLCPGCHVGGPQAKADRTIPTDKLLDQNICFIWHALDVAGWNYLERHYTGVDRRFTLHTEGKCEDCQVEP